VSSVDCFIPDAEADTTPHAIAAYIDAYTDSDGLIVDPFCQSATIVLEALKAGRRVVAVNFNPLDALRTRLALTAVSTRELTAAVTRLADSPKPTATLREHLQRLYRTTCPHCSRETIADYFVWERGDELPKQVHYSCPACGEEGIRDCDERDAGVFSKVQPRGLHYWYALDRVAREQDKGRKFAASLLDLYTSRNLYVLSNLVLKVEDLFSGSAVHDFLRLALLQCLELGSKLNVPPDEPASPTASHLRLPPRFVERNVWQLFEEAARQLAQRPSVPAVTLAANVQDVLSPPLTEQASEPARAFVGHSSVRQLAPQLPAGSVDLVWTRPPMLGREHWALPYLWTGWLYGHEESALLWPLAKQRSPDWSWYLQAMRTTLLALRKVLATDGRIVFFGRDRGLAYHEAVCLAAEGATLRLENALYHSSESEIATEPYAGLRGDYRVTWALGTSTPPWPMSADELAAKVRQGAVEAAEETLQQRAEPAPFVRLHCHIWEALAQQGLLQRIMSIEERVSPREQVQAALDEEVDHIFVQLWESQQDHRCWWWLAQPLVPPPLSERVERSVNETLEAVETIETTDFTLAINKHFPGVLTPDREWVMACLKSYGQQVGPAWWSLRQEERRGQRAKARELTLGHLQALGHRLDYDVHLGTEGFDVQWVQAEKDVLAFIVLDSTALSRLLALQSPDDSTAKRKIVIVAEARQQLLRLKLARSMWLRKPLAEQGWQFIKDADLQSWASHEEIALADLDSFVGLDLLAARDRTQLPLI